ncbi:MAG: hypothetical protein ACFBSE_11835 [Prochloraceae cyanobacterium]
MTLFLLIGGEDGGIGKSTFSTFVVQYLIDRGLLICLVDANRLKKDVKAKYEKKDYAKKVTFEDVIFSESNKRDTEANLIYELAAEEGQNIVVNLPAEIHEILVDWFETNDILEMAGEDRVEICYFHVSNGTKENLNSFEKALDFFGERAKVVLVKNEYKCEDWQLFESAEKRLKKVGGRTLIMPALHQKYKNPIDEYNLSWQEAREYENTDKGYRKIARNNVKKCLKAIYTQLDDLVVASSKSKNKNSSSNNPEENGTGTKRKSRSRQSRKPDNTSEQIQNNSPSLEDKKDLDLVAKSLNEKDKAIENNAENLTETVNSSALVPVEFNNSNGQ